MGPEVLGFGGLGWNLHVRDQGFQWLAQMLARDSKGRAAVVVCVGEASRHMSVVSVCVCLCVPVWEGCSRCARLTC